MKKSNIVLIGTFLIISVVSCLFGMKREAEQKLADGTPAAKVQNSEDAQALPSQVPVKLFGLKNSGTDCF